MGSIFFWFALVTFFSLGFVTTNIFAAGTNFTQQIYPITECNDGIDNDGDGGIDFATDPQCISWTDNSESVVGITPQLGGTPVSSPVQQPDSQGGEAIDQPQEDTVDSLGEIIQREFSWDALGSILGIENLSELLGEESDEVLFVAAFVLFVALLSGIVGLAAIMYYSKINDKKIIKSKNS